MSPAETHRNVLLLISRIRGSHSTMEEIFLRGSCLNMFEILRAVYPDAQMYYNMDHVITKIGDRFYDITGEAKPTPNHERFGAANDKLWMRRAYSQMKRFENKHVRHVPQDQNPNQDNKTHD